VIGRIGVCSWSLRPGSPEELAERARAAGVSWVQIALDPIRRGAWDLGRTVDALGRAGIGVASGMMAMEGEDYSTLESIRRTGGVVPDSTWAANLAAAGENAGIARALGIGLVSFHAGFIPHGAGDPTRAGVLERVRALARVFGKEHIGVALETGQESAATLLGALAELPGVGVNFDPANMILYGMGDPVDSLRALSGRVVQAHIKDAVRAARPGEWGTEVRVGTGAVDWPAFLAEVRRVPVMCDLIIEREAGQARVEDVAAAMALLRRQAAT